jgi:flagellar basal-body rod protein FlgG
MTGIQSLVQSMQAQWQRQEILANNLANASTPGFKKDDLALVSAAAALASPGANLLPLASGSSLLQWTDFSQGFIRETGRVLDAAISGPGFFVIDTPAGARYTRAGGFSVGRDGFLVGPNGGQVLGQRGPIAVTSSRISVSPNGEVHDGGRLVDSLRVVDFPQPYRLVKEGDGLFAPADPTAEPTAAKGYEVAGGALEASNVSTMEVMVSMIEVLRTYEAAQRAMQAVEEANQKATSDIGKVA